MWQSSERQNKYKKALAELFHVGDTISLQIYAVKNY
jgi:hypothetical protein